MKILTTTIARIIFAIPFLIFGLNHFMKADMMAGMVPSFLPGGVSGCIYLEHCSLARRYALSLGNISVKPALLLPHSCLSQLSRFIFPE